MTPPATPTAEERPLRIGDIFELGEPWRIVKFLDEPDAGLCVVENARGYRLSVPIMWLEHGRAAKRAKDVLKRELEAARAEVANLRATLQTVRKLATETPAYKTRQRTVELIIRATGAALAPAGSGSGGGEP